MLPKRSKRKRPPIKKPKRPKLLIKLAVPQLKRRIKLQLPKKVLKLRMSSLNLLQVIQKMPLLIQRKLQFHSRLLKSKKKK